MKEKVGKNSILYYGSACHWQALPLANCDSLSAIVLLRNARTTAASHQHARGTVPLAAMPHRGVYGRFLRGQRAAAAARVIVLVASFLNTPLALL